MEFIYKRQPVSVSLAADGIEVKYDNAYREVRDLVTRIYYLSLVKLAMKSLGYRDIRITNRGGSVVLTAKPPRDRTPTRISHVEAEYNAGLIGIDYKFFPANKCVEEDRNIVEAMSVIGVDAVAVNAAPKTVEAGVELRRNNIPILGDKKVN